MFSGSLISRRRFLGLAAAGLAGATGLYAWRIEPHWVEIVRRDPPIVQLPPPLEGQTLVQLSDLHVGGQVDDDFLIDGFEIVNGLKPAFIALTGDFMTCRGDEQLARTLRVMEHLRPARLGTVAVLGNHDHRPHFRNRDVAGHLAGGLQDQGITVLRNERRTLGGLTFVGLDDLWRGKFDLPKAVGGLAADEPAVALCHNPDGADLPGWGKFRGWILAGHTHGGQCRLQRLRPSGRAGCPCSLGTPVSESR